MLMRRERMPAAIRTILVSVVVAANCISTALAETSYSRVANLPPLRVSLTDLQEVLDRGSLLMIAADGTNPIVRENIQLAKRDVRLSFGGHRLDSPESKIPNSIDSFKYSAFTREHFETTQIPSPITQIELSFSDSQRRLFIEGQSPEQVDALFVALKDDLSRLETPVGGYGLRRFYEVFFVPALYVGFGMLFMRWYLTRRSAALWQFLVVTGLLAIAMMLPADVLFAGFSAVRGDPSFMVRYNPQIGFWGLALSVITIAISFIIPLIQQRSVKKPLKRQPANR
jgi:hypothetical protein